MRSLPDLPVTYILPQLDQAMEHGNKHVLVAPPGAGKTTLVPLHFLHQDWSGADKIIVLEPRRIAARASAKRMAQLLGEEVGQTVGYRMRLENKTSASTRVLVVTEGVFARMILEDPELKDVKAVLFDEFHERSLDADFGLALVLDVQAALRPDLKILVMSATLDGARVAALLGDDAQVIKSEGRSYPIDIRYRERKPQERVEDAMAQAIRDALFDETGSILAFLPGQGEIDRVARLLEPSLGANIMLCPLYGAMEGRDQDAAIKPSPEGKRKVVLATSIAETSLTIDGVRVVIDSGLSRVPHYEPATGLTRLETVRASRAAVDQRAGRAGRTEAGIAIRLWHQGQTASLPPFSTPEILEADLSGLLLDCAAWGVNDPSELQFLDEPPRPALNEARNLLMELGALDGDGRLTPDGQAMRELALPARLAHMVAKAKPRGEGLYAAELALLLTERGLGGSDIDLEERFRKFKQDRSDRAQRAKQLAKRIGGNSDGETSSIGRLLLDAYPDRLAKPRGAAGQFVLANGRGGEIDAASSLSKASWLVVAELTGRADRSRILAAAEVSEAEIRFVLGHKIKTGRQVLYDAEKNSLRAREATRIGQFALQEKQMAAPSGEEADLGVIDTVRQYGLQILPWGKEAETLRCRLSWLYQGLGEPWPAMDDKTLIDRLEDWLLPFLTGEARLDKIPFATISNGLRLLVPYDLQRKIDALAPVSFEVPTGSNITIRYDADQPVIAVRVQELFGLTTHPSIADGKVPLVLELLSPAHKPIQITRDLPRFWAGSWADVRADMRGRYPKHVWPEDPANAPPTGRAKPRGQ
ncbi:ATP-dependent helicase HrpB [Paenochrobactrum pullorum]|uniref:ATP-dependent helicase HrpB n=1 Tax=Paenochrobactrum pullorum TaxID=1324351 RepID=UPI0035BBB008